MLGARKAKRAPDAHLHAVRADAPPAAGVLGADDCHGNDGHSGFERQAAHPPARAPERPRAHARALGKDDHAVAALEDLARGVHRAGVAGPAVDGESSERTQKPRLPAALEELALGHVVDGPPKQRADDERVEKAAVVGGEQQRPAAG